MVALNVRFTHLSKAVQRTIYYNAAPGEDLRLEDMFVPFPHEVLDSSGPAEDSEHGTKTSTDLDEPTHLATSGTSSNTVPVKAESLFLQAISNAIVKHDDRLPIPSSSKVKLSDLPSPVDSGLVFQSESALLPHEDFSDSDDEEDTKQSKALAEVDEDVAKMLLYTPTGKWASFANEPIVDVEVVADLNNSSKLLVAPEVSLVSNSTWLAGAKYDAYLKRGTLGGKRITYISKTWKFYEEWEGLFSEVRSCKPQPHNHFTCSDSSPFTPATTSSVHSKAKSFPPSLASTLVLERSVSPWLSPTRNSGLKRHPTCRTRLKTSVSLHSTAYTLVVLYTVHPNCGTFLLGLMVT